jgi:hypothetical protein
MLFEKVQRQHTSDSLSANTHSKLALLFLSTILLETTVSVLILLQGEDG